ncbi:MAG: hypothetical protein HOE76_03565 [Euryarchaeota archaeon]|jgi:hypothetical protein|nr:hypothetical protein [Euryarchaeota archaeon]MBT4981784.1 hypothetical protein [Euryarchaeota archaeon]MBT5184112.1 hypothetical protein [Euryarchaeota archaeon]
MLDPISELVVAIGESVAKDSEFLNTESKTKSRIIHALYYIVPISLLVGFYIWKMY